MSGQPGEQIPGRDFAPQYHNWPSPGVHGRGKITAMTLFDLTLQTRSSLHPEGEPDDFVSEFTGFVHAEAEDGLTRKVGKVHAWRINAGLAACQGEPLSSVCDAHSD